jgi:DEAD/DEAH box helicase domain-containing protein
LSLEQLLQEWRGSPRFMGNVAAWRTLAAQPARAQPMPPGLDTRLAAVLTGRGIAALYTHQAQAWEAAQNGEHLAIVTPTASGKTLCYNLPILHSLLNNPDARALYLFPTKALAQDQLAELRRWAAELDSPPHPLTPATYDGDTPSAERPRIRKTARLLLTNPDMLHMGILPYHTQWAAFLGGLRYVVIDEMHTYRGVFGSHVANVLRRLQRLCALYGSAPQFVCTSATIANPRTLAERLIEQPVTLIDDNGAPRPEKHVLLLNPPLLDAEGGIRRSATLEATDRAADCLEAGLQTIVFGRSRLTTELLLSYVREKTPQAVRGYRGGYLPHERRAIEAGLRSGDVRAVVATNALELGIDIGQLQACIVCGYPGSIASTWQQMGRAGRTNETALALLVATAGPLDQYVVQHPEFVFERSPEQALINPDNLMLLLDHVRCAVFELPFAAGEGFGRSPFVADALQLLAEEGEVHAHENAGGGQWFWSGESYPARRVSLRSAGNDAVVIQAVGEYQGEERLRRGGSTAPPTATVIGSVEHAGAPRLVHEGAIYLHEGRMYQVRTLDLDNLRADVQPVDVDYYTEASAETAVAVLAVHDQRADAHTSTAWGDVEVTSQVIGYRRIMRHTHTTLGVQPLEYPPQTLVTSAWWLALQPAAQAALEGAGLWHDSINNYGPNWTETRRAVRARDRYRCTQCGAPEPRGQEHDVHHLTPFRAFGYIPGVNDLYLLANRLENLVLVCRACHRRIETAGRLRTGMDGLAYSLASLAPLHLMCDRGDINLYVARSEGHYAGQASGAAAVRLAPRPANSDIDFMSDEPRVACGLDDGESDSPAQPLNRSPAQLATIYLYEQIPAGLGFSAALFDLHNTLLHAAREQIRACGCRAGCPACVGPVLDDQPYQLDTKRLTLGVLDVLLG